MLFPAAEFAPTDDNLSLVIAGLLQVPKIHGRADSFGCLFRPPCARTAPTSTATIPTEKIAPCPSQPTSTSSTASRAAAPPTSRAPAAPSSPSLPLGCPRAREGNVFDVKASPTSEQASVVVSVVNEAATRERQDAAAVLRASLKKGPAGDLEL